MPVHVWSLCLHWQVCLCVENGVCGIERGKCAQIQSNAPYSSPSHTREGGEGRWWCRVCVHVHVCVCACAGII